MATKKSSSEKSITMPNGVKIPVATPTASEAPKKLVSSIIKIKIATVSGVRTYGVTEKTFKKYGAIPNRLVDDIKVYAKKVPVYYHDIGVTRKIPIAPEQKEKYFFEEDINKFVKYVPTATTQILVEKKDGTTEIITTTQEKVRSGLYAPKRADGRVVKETGRNVYVREKNVARRSPTIQERREQQSSGLIPAGWQTITVYDVTITSESGNIKFSGVITGYSKVNREPRTLADMQEETYKFMQHELIANHNYTYDDVLEAEIISESTQRFMS